MGHLYTPILYQGLQNDTASCPNDNVLINKLIINRTMEQRLNKSLTRLLRRRAVVHAYLVEDEIEKTISGCLNLEKFSYLCSPN